MISGRVSGFDSRAQRTPSQKVQEPAIRNRWAQCICLGYQPEDVSNPIRELEWGRSSSAVIKLGTQNNQAKKPGAKDIYFMGE
jgi:hypothetical protein